MFKPDELPLRRRTWLKIASIPKNRTGWELTDCTDVSDEDLRVIRKWLASVKDGKVIRASDRPTTCGVGLYLYGAPGHGKTTLALAILQEAIRTFDYDSLDVAPGNTMIRPCYFTQYSDLLELKGALMNEPSADQVRIWDGIMGESKDDTYNIRILVIDDIGKEHKSGSGWQSDMLHQVIRTRFNNGLPTVITSNIDDIEAAYGSATDSFMNEAFVKIKLKSPKGDLRR
jgi:DNA replication protein DnaC